MGDEGRRLSVWNESQYKDHVRYIVCGGIA